MNIGGPANAAGDAVDPANKLNLLHHGPLAQWWHILIKTVLTEFAEDTQAELSNVKTSNKVQLGSLIVQLVCICPSKTRISLLFMPRHEHRVS